MSTSTHPESVRGERLPPEQRFWQRYSPHYEAQLSGVGSIAIHCLVAGLLLLGGFLSWLGFSSRPSKLKFDGVFVAGNSAASSQESPGNDASAVEVATTGNLTPAAASFVPADRSALPDPAEAPAKSPPRPQQLGDSKDMLKILDRLKNSPIPSAIAKGTGPPRVGDPAGAKSGPVGNMASKPVPRELRWDLSFNTRDGRDYLRQLEGLGAILAIPTGTGGSNYKIVRELSRRPARLLDEDPGKIQGICWRDEDPKAVAGLMEALGISNRPDHFAAFFPAEVEAKLARLEREFAGRDENQIGRTRFRVAWSGSRYDLVVIEQTPLR